MNQWLTVVAVSPLEHIAEIDILAISLILESVNEIWISGIQSLLSNHLILLFILSDKIEAQENHGSCHTSVAG